ncbi:MAG: photosystem II biogenesis protein Psp29, partial [Actinomycetota bacterium]
EEKVTKDLDLYRSNLEKMAQVRIVMEDALQAERKKREQRGAKATVSPPNGSPEGDN